MDKVSVDEWVCVSHFRCAESSDNKFYARQLVYTYPVGSMTCAKCCAKVRLDASHRAYALREMPCGDTLRYSGLVCSDCYQDLPDDMFGGIPGRVRLAVCCKEVCRACSPLVVASEPFEVLTMTLVNSQTRDDGSVGELLRKRLLAKRCLARFQAAVERARVRRLGMQTLLMCPF